MVIPHIYIYIYIRRAQRSSGSELDQWVDGSNRLRDMFNFCLTNFSLNNVHKGSQTASYLKIIFFFLKNKAFKKNYISVTRTDNKIGKFCKLNRQ